MKFIAYTTKGLEQVALEEIQSVCSDAEILEVKDKRILFQTDCATENLLSLRTIDDIGLLIARLSSVSESKDIAEETESLDLQYYKKQIARIRDLDPSNFSLTIGLSATGKIKAAELIQVISKLIAKKYSWVFTELDHSGFDIRIFGDHTDFYFSARLTKDSLHHRSYKVVSKEGSLRPTIAAAMVRLVTKDKANLKIVDNFCGSGTILCEALLSGHEVFGGDIDPNSVQITKQNLAGLGCKIDEKIKPLDAAATNWPDNFFDCAISNLPWDKQIKITSISELYQRSLSEYSRILKSDGKLCLLVSKPELLIKYAKQYFPNKNIQSLPIGILGQNPTIVLINTQHIVD